jgi:hypothetical protein
MARLRNDVSFVIRSWRAALTRASALLQGWAAQAAEQLNPQTVWHRLCDHLKHILAGIGPPNILRLLANHANRIG